jgi:hypothetical protein
VATVDDKWSPTVGTDVGGLLEGTSTDASVPPPSQGKSDPPRVLVAKLMGVAEIAVLIEPESEYELPPEVRHVDGTFSALHWRDCVTGQTPGCPSHIVFGTSQVFPVEKWFLRRKSLKKRRGVFEAIGIRVVEEYALPSASQEGNRFHFPASNTPGCGPDGSQVVNCDIPEALQVGQPYGFFSTAMPDLYWELAPSVPEHADGDNISSPPLPTTEQNNTFTMSMWRRQRLAGQFLECRAVVADHQRIPDPACRNW